MVRSNRHMLLQQILAQLDIELERLQKLRAVVAGLRRPARRAPKLAPEPDPVPAIEPAAPSPVSKEEPHRRVRRWRISPRPTRTPASPKSVRAVETTALTSAIPAGPVIVSATDLARERERRAKVRLAAVAAPAVREEVNLEALTRDIAARWVSPRQRSNS